MKRELVLGAVGICIVAALGVWLFLYLTGEKVTTYTPSTAGTGSPGASPSREVPPGYAEYRNVFFRISLLYPKDMAVAERKGEGTTLTVTFEGAKKEQAFQIYVLPYGDTQITEKRFLLDNPSGVMASSTEITLDGVRASAFFSTDTLLGETREVWFINKGFLYEVTTYKAFDKELMEIMQSWKFL